MPEPKRRPLRDGAVLLGGERPYATETSTSYQLHGDAGTSIGLRNFGSALDEVTTFMGPLPPAEYAARARMRSYRNAATGMVALTHCDTARQLAWMAIEYASACLYASAPLAGLEAINLLCNRLLKTAMSAEALDDLLRSADDE